MAIEHAIRAGEALIQAKQLVEHGQWLPWLRDNCKMSERTAQNYMRVARNQDALANPHHDLDLNLNAAIKTLAAPKALIILPEPRMCRRGDWEADTRFCVVWIAESRQHPGFYWCGAVDGRYPSEDDDEIDLQSQHYRRPMKLEWLAQAIEYMTRHKPSRFAWSDCPVDPWFLGKEAEIDLAETADDECETRSLPKEEGEQVQRALHGRPRDTRPRR